MVAKNVDQRQIEIIGKNIERLLNENHMSQAQLASILGLSESAIGKWLLGKNAPSVGNINKIATYFHVNVSDIVDDRPQNSSSQKRRYLMDKIAKADESKLRKIDKLMELIDDEESRDDG